MYLNALDNQVVPDSMLNCLPDNIPFDAKFKPGTNQTPRILGCQIVTKAKWWSPTTGQNKPQ